MGGCGGSGILSSNRISSQFLNKVLDNSERQQFRQGVRQPTSTASKLVSIPWTPIFLFFKFLFQRENRRRFKQP